jgi:DNA end-binding protein Ku
MPRPIWSGSLSFGLVNIPVRLFSATREETLDFDLLRKSDLSPIKYLRVSRVDGEEVPYDELVRGYEYRKGDYVVLTEEDFRKADVKKTKSIDILDFTEEKEIDPVYYEKPYYLEPQKGAEKPYVLLIDALKKAGKVGIAKFVLRTRERLAVVRPMENILVLEQMRYEREIKSTEGLNIPQDIRVDERELEMALTLINHMTEAYEPSGFKDTYNQELMDVIEEKAKGQTVRPKGEEPQPTEVKNLMETLKKSLEEAQNKK